MPNVIDIVAGARPNFMKVAPILRAAEESGVPFTTRLVHTGQHYDQAMSDVFFQQLGIRKPDVHLGVGSGSQGEQTAKIIVAYERHLLENSTIGTVVVGDVNSTMACTLAASKLGVPVAHVEAGLRSMDRTMPEEINRLVTDVLADLLLVSEPAGLGNLAAEGIAPEKIEYVGNVMIDTLLNELPQAKALGMPAALGLEGKYALVTLHRPSNVDDPDRLAQLVDVLAEVAKRVTVVFPVHPRTRKRLAEFGLEDRLAATSGVTLLPPQGYRENLGLMAGSAVVLTDSGGIQEETTQLSIPCLTVRPNTERPVTVDRGTSTLVGDALDQIVPLVDDVLAGRYKSGAAIDGWDGKAAVRIVERLTKAWGER